MRKGLVYLRFADDSHSDVQKSWEPLVGKGRLLFPFQMERPFAGFLRGFCFLR